MILQRLIYITISLVFLAACSNTRTATAPKTDSTISIDGDLSDWKTGESTIESTEEMSYYATHDDEYLYLFVDIKSPFRDNAIRRSGFIIYLNHSKDTRKRVGLAFPSGSFNLLREDPGTYHSMTQDPEWLQDPANQELITELAKENFERIMIVERADGKSDPDYGFANKSQIEIDGFAIATDETKRLTTIEVKIPLNGSSIFGITKESLWLGFAVEPPDFRIREQQTDMGYRNSGQYGNQQRRQPSAADQRRSLSRNLGEYERWYQLDLN